MVSARSTSVQPSRINPASHSERSCSSSTISSPLAEVLAGRRDSCSSINASKPITSGSGNNSTSNRPRRIASRVKSSRISSAPMDAE
ncbi:hypothetical protein D3C84_925110 [compost metagenome]